MSASLENLIELLGEETTLKIVEAYPGLRLNVPVKMPKKHALLGVLEDDALADLIRYFGGVEFVVPIARNWRIGIYMRQTPSLTRAEIARRVGCSEDRVFAILREQRQKRNQLTFNF